VVSKRKTWKIEIRIKVEKRKRIWVKEDREARMRKLEEIRKENDYGGGIIGK